MPSSSKILYIVLVFLLGLATRSSFVNASNSANNNGADQFRRQDREVTYGDTTREQIMETRARRKRQFKHMILDARKKLADHAAGEITLTAEKKKALENQMDIFQRKLDTMKDELEDWVGAAGWRWKTLRPIRGSVAVYIKT
jgi:predicted aminopeptidase